jgi:hypothetical protein
LKTRILLSLVITLTAGASIAAQTDGALREVTLYWFSPRHLIDNEKRDRSRSSVNFESGNRGPDRADEYDLRYGGMVLGTPTKHGEASRLLTDWLGVLDCRSMIVDLGAKQWQDFKETPPFPKPKTLEPPRALSQPVCAVNTSAGRRDFSPYRQFVEVNPGHIYLMRFLRGSKVRYVMFRVESFVERENCVLSWKLVKPPNVDDNESF